MVQLVEGWCALMQVGADECSFVQMLRIGASLSRLVQVRACLPSCCMLLQFGADFCSLARHSRGW